MAMTIWGRGGNGGNYAAITALVNIPATFSAALFYEFILADSSRGQSLICRTKVRNAILISTILVITPEHLDFLTGHLAHAEHKEAVVSGRDRRRSTNSSYEGKGHIQAIEQAETA